MPADPGAVGEPIDALLRLIRDLYEMSKADGFPITHYFYEMPFIGKQVNSRTSKRLMGMAGVVEMFAFQKKALGCYEVDISEWRKHFLGRGSGFKKAPGGKKYLPGHDPKELAIQRCAEYGWHTDIHDAAEACGVLDYSLTMIPKYHRPWRDNALMGGML